MLKRENCNGKWGVINDYLDRRVRGRRKERLESHLALCERCRSMLEDVKDLRNLLASEKTPPAPAGFWEQCYTRISDSADGCTSRRRCGLKTTLGILITSAAALAGLLWFGLMQLPNKQLPISIYMMEHASFAAAHPLSMASHEILLLSCQTEHWIGGTKDSGNDLPDVQAF